MVSTLAQIRLLSFSFSGLCWFSAVCPKFASIIRALVSICKNKQMRQTKSNLSPLLIWLFKIRFKSLASGIPKMFSSFSMPGKMFVCSVSSGQTPPWYCAVLIRVLWAGRGLSGWVVVKTWGPWHFPEQSYDMAVHGCSIRDSVGLLLAFIIYFLTYMFLYLIYPQCVSNRCKRYLQISNEKRQK